MNVLLGPAALWTTLPTFIGVVWPLAMLVVPSRTVISGGIAVTAPETTNVKGFSTPSPLSASLFPNDIVSDPPDQTAPVFNVTVKVVVCPAVRLVRPGWPTVKCAVFGKRRGQVRV